ncbi:hypothetical protein RQP46_004363 [Phenoliferia psychrophenolica]
MDSTALLGHLLGRLTNDLEFLHAQRLLSTADLDQIKAKLPSPHSTPLTIVSSSAPGSSALEGGLAHLSLGGGEVATAGGGAPLGTARALWDYAQSQPSDLAFTKGDIITIIEESSADWWLGSINGRQGIFPSNVRFPPVSLTVPELTFTNTSYQAPAPYQQPQYQQQQPAYQPYQQQPQYSPAPYSAPMYDQKVETYHPPAPPQQQQPQAVAPAAGPSGGPPPIPPKKKFGGKLGGMMATSFAGGIGFGAGTAIASEAVHAIF